MPQARKTAQTPEPPAPAPDGVRLRFDRGERRAAVSVDATRGLASWDEATRTFEFVLATETPCRTYRWDERTWMCFEVDEVLPMAALADVEGIRGAPILNTHWSYSLDNVLGVIDEARVEGTSLICRGRLSGRDDIAEIRQDVADGILRNMSVGFQILTENAPEVRGDGEVPLVTVTSWRCCEASIVPVPADPTAQTRSQKGRPMAGPKSSTRGKRELTEEEQKRADEAAAAAAGTEDEGERDAVADAQAEVEAAEAALQAAKDKLAEAEAAGEGGSDDDAAAAAEEAARAARKTAARGAAPTAGKTVVAGLRAIAVREGREDDFDAMAAAGATVEELRSVALTALRTSNVEIGARSGAGERSEKPKLLSFHQVRAAKAAAAANRK